jgi:hypothetical protein
MPGAESDTKVRAHGGEGCLMTDERWRHFSGIVNEAFNSETRTVALRKRIVAGVKRTLRDGRRIMTRRRTTRSGSTE